jgi:predicted HD superfamily hydrolase involved in NAD metabolism
MAAPTYEEALRAVFKRLGPTSAEHCVAVAETAARLAKTYSVEESAARLAGLLHDWSRDEDRERLLDEAETGEGSITDVDRCVPYLLHARCGAMALLEAFPDLDPQIVNAVRHHTTGASRMSDLDRVVYIADMIEPRRGFRGVEELRRAVGEVDLAELYARSYAASLLHLINGRKHIHPDSVAAWNAIVAEAEQ